MQCHEHGNLAAVLYGSLKSIDPSGLGHALSQTQRYVEVVLVLTDSTM